MALLSKRMMVAVRRDYHAAWELRPCFNDVGGLVLAGDCPVPEVVFPAGSRSYALQRCVNLGEPFVQHVVPGLVVWTVGLEDARVVRGGLCAGGVLEAGQGAAAAEVCDALVAAGEPVERAQRVLARAPVWPQARILEAAEALRALFYQFSGWRPELMEENHLKTLQNRQIQQAIEDQKRVGMQALYAFEKERVLLASIRAGERSEARRLLNEMLAAIYMSSPQLAVLRARAVEMMSCLTRAAIEDNPLLEPLIQRNHRWTERLVEARDFEDLSHVLMDALDDFIDGIYLHGSNRSNVKVRLALDFIAAQYMRSISLSDVAAHVGLSTCRLSHLVKQHTGRTVLQIIREVRIRQAQVLLERSQKSCTDIAYECGFGDQSYFIKHFKRLTGTTPSRYRRVRSG